MFSFRKSDVSLLNCCGKIKTLSYILDVNIFTPYLDLIKFTFLLSPLQMFGVTKS
jgi:hypothetical protein